MNSKRQSRYRLSYKNEAINAESQPSISCYPVESAPPPVIFNDNKCLFCLKLENKEFYRICHRLSSVLMIATPGVLCALALRINRHRGTKYAKNLNNAITSK